MNFILRNQKAQFGKVYSGYGDRDRYQAGGNLTRLRGTTRLTLIGLANNINQRNFSPMDLFGAMSGGGQGGGRMVIMGGGRGMGGGGSPNMMRFGGGGSNAGNFFVNQQGGLTTTHSGGLNYAGQWGKKLAVTGSAFLNGSANANLQAVSREYLPPQDSLAFYDQNQASDTDNFNQRYEARFEWTVDSLNSIILARQKVIDQGRAYWKRAILSTVAGQAADSLIFYPLAFAGTWSWQLIGTIMATHYTLKVAIEVLGVPLSWQTVVFLKRAEGVDHYDRTTNFNPFGLRVDNDAPSPSESAGVRIP